MSTHLLPERNDVVGRYHHRPHARQAHAPSSILIPDVDEVLRGRGERRLETMASGTPSHGSDPGLLRGARVMAAIVDPLDPTDPSLHRERSIGVVFSQIS